MTVDVENTDATRANAKRFAASSPEDVRAAVTAAVAKCGNMREDIVPILAEVNRTVGYLPPAAFTEIGKQLRVPVSQLFSVASFYQMLSTQPRGRHVIQFCESAPCHVVGGRQVWNALLDELGIQPGETSADGKWTLQTVSCLGVCAVGPVVVVDEDMYGNVEPDQVKKILGRYS
jgi:NADH-quinone oxidoreductase subunit E